MTDVAAGSLISGEGASSSDLDLVVMLLFEGNWLDAPSEWRQPIPRDEP